MVLERRRSAAEEGAYQARISWYRQMTDWLPVLVSYVDRDLRYQYNNKAYADWFGLKDVSELAGRSLVEVLGPAALEKIAPYVQLALSGERVSFESTVPYLEGGTRTVEATYAPHVEAGEVVGFFAMVTDISERRRMEESLIRADKLESLGHLAGGIAHDFNNLLTGILGNLELAEMAIMEDGADDALERLRRCRAGSLQAQELTLQLLAFSRGGAPVKTLAMPARDLREAAELAMHGGRIRLECTIPDDLWPVEYDAGQLGQVVSNLVINAVQASKGAGAIQVIAANCPAGPSGTHRVEVQVVDQGEGVPLDCRARVFDPYFTTKPGGRGLGLTTAYKVVSAHGGGLDFESVSGVGTTFRFWLPAYPDRTTSEGLVEVTPPIARRRMLVMDDDDAVRDILRTLLRRSGHEVVAAREGASAVALYRQALAAKTPFDVVILDLTVVGGMGGAEAAQAILELDPGARLLVSSGYSHDPVMADYRRHGFCAVLPKPYGAVQLEIALSHALAHRQSDLKGEEE